MKVSEKDRRAALEHLKECFKPGDRVSIILRHVSRSGMMRSISVLDKDNADVSYWVSQLLEWPLDRNNGGVRVGGCGMDMGFHLVYTLGCLLNKAGFGCIGKDCPSNDHSNGDRDYTPHTYGIHQGGEGTIDLGAEHWHKDGGYALHHRWI